MKIVLLAEFGGELSLEYLKGILKNRINLDSIIIIGDKYNEHRKQLVLKRTKGAYRFPCLIELLAGSIIPCYFVDEVNSPWTEEVFKRLKPDLVVSGCTKLIKRPLWRIPTYGMLNCHSGLIQKYRGSSCVEWAIYNDEPVGASCHLIDESIDAGPLVYQATLNIKEGDEYHLIRARMIQHQAIVMLKGVEKALDNPECFSERVEKGDYYKPMRDRSLIQEIISKLNNKQYSHYRLPDSIDISDI